MWRRLANAVRELRRSFGGAFDPYRPELHYMRGPGPKWRARHLGTDSGSERTPIARPVLAGRDA
jgi:hypothetical protein